MRKLVVLFIVFELFSLVFMPFQKANDNIFSIKIVERQITSNESIQEMPDIFEDIIVWTDYRNVVNLSEPHFEKKNTDIYMYNISLRKEYRITTNESAQRHPKVFDKWIVYRDWRHQNEVTLYDNIYAFNLVTEKETSIPKSYGGSPAIYNDKVVFVDYRNYTLSSYDIYLHNLTTGEEIPISTNNESQNSPAIWENYVVWYDERNGKEDIYMYDLSKKEEKRITTDNSQPVGALGGTGPSERVNIYGDKIIWLDYNGREDKKIVDIMMYNITTSKTTILIKDIIAEPGEFAIYGDNVIYVDTSYYQSELILYNMKYNKNWSLSIKSLQDVNIWKNRIVFTSFGPHKKDFDDIFMIEFDLIEIELPKIKEKCNIGYLIAGVIVLVVVSIVSFYYCWRKKVKK